MSWFYGISTDSDKCAVGTHLVVIHTASPLPQDPAISPSQFDYSQWFKENDLEPDTEPRFPLDAWNVVDGRSGYQWIASIKTYLDWRSGLSWRRSGSRFHPEVEHYIRALNFLNCEVRTYETAAAVVPRKRPQSVGVPAKKKSAVAR